MAITSRAESGRRVDELFPNLRGHYDLAFSEPEVAQLAACDVVYFATPHNVAMNTVPELLAAGTPGDRPVGRLPPAGCGAVVALVW